MVKELIIAMLLLSGLFSRNAFSQQQSFSRPCGIYTKGAAQPGQYLSAIRNYPFVDGHLLLMRWEQVETDENIFDFSVIEQAVQTLQGYNQKMTLLILCNAVPAYILNNPNVEKYYNVSPLGTETTLTAVPWDPIANARQVNFLDVVSSRLVFDAVSQTMVPLRDHPVLKQVAIQVIGVGGLRDPQGSIAGISGYSRTLIANTFSTTTQQYITKFPNQYKYINVLRINDGNTSPDLTTYILDHLNGTFNAGTTPMLGYINEQLACATPYTSSALIFPHIDTTFIMFQMLSSWRNPSSSHAVHTNPCVSDTTGPDVAMQYGFNSFNATYFEIWVQDLDWAGYNTLFQNWHDALQNQCGQPLEIADADANAVKLYPNPAQDVLQLNLGNLVGTAVRIRLVDVMGKTVLTQDFANSQQVEAVTVASLARGIYMAVIENATTRATQKVVLH